MGLAARKLRNARRSFCLPDNSINSSFRVKTEVSISTRIWEEPYVSRAVVSSLVLAAGSGSLVLAAWFWQSSSESVPVSRKPTIPELALSGQIHYQILQVFLTTGYTSPGYIAP
jgi:hypothetical protein